MKKTILVLVILAFSTLSDGKDKVKLNSNRFRSINNIAFSVGEKLTYRLHYGFIDAGEATLEVKRYNNKIQGRELLHIVGLGRTISAFDWFFKVRDKYESYLDAEGLFPWYFIRRVNEGGTKSFRKVFLLVEQEKRSNANAIAQTFEYEEEKVTLYNSSV